MHFSACAAVICRICHRPVCCSRRAADCGCCGDSMVQAPTLLQSVPFTGYQISVSNKCSSQPKSIHGTNRSCSRPVISLHHMMPWPWGPRLYRQHACGEASSTSAGARPHLRPFWFCRVRAAGAKASKAPAKSTAAAGKAPATPKQPALSPLGQPLVSDSPASKLGRRSFHTLNIAGLVKPAHWWVKRPGGLRGCSGLCRRQRHLFE